jgi:hypothetical protein
MSFLADIDHALLGAPDNLITVGLILSGIFAWLVAIYGRPAFKAAVLGWILVP